jgi:predicted RNA binding protein YcfA (HicA-like mRNA interferase family)
MGRLAGFRQREVAGRLRKFGFRFDLAGADSHEVWRHSKTGRKATVPHRASDIAEGTLRAILHEVGIEVNDFLRACSELKTPATFGPPAKFIVSGAGEG